MNWVFDAYSNVYNAAMMQTQTRGHDVATAKEQVHVKRSPILGFFGRR